MQQTNSAVSAPLTWIFRNTLIKSTFAHSDHMQQERSESAREPGGIALYKSDDDNNDDDDDDDHHQQQQGALRSNRDATEQLSS